MGTGTLRLNISNADIWKFFLLCCLMVILCGVVVGSLFQFEAKSLGTSILGGTVAGVILILFDIIMMKGLQYEEMEQKKRFDDLSNDIKEIKDKIERK